MNLFSYDSQPTGAGTSVLVFLHAYPQDFEMWRPQLEAFSAKRRVVAPDLRGFGQSPCASNAFFFESYVDDLHALLNEKKLGPVILCGISLGGYVALRYQNRHPERVQALVLADSRATRDDNDTLLKRADSLAFIRRHGVEPYARQFVKSLVVREDLYPDLIRRMTKLTPDALARALVSLVSRLDLDGELSKIGCPTLLLFGENDTISPPAVGETMRAQIPGAELQILARAGHLSNVDEPEAFNAALSDFLRRRGL